MRLSRFIPDFALEASYRRQPLHILVHATRFLLGWITSHVATSCNNRPCRANFAFAKFGFILIMAFSFLPMMNAFATGPSSLDISYNPIVFILNIKAAHVTDHPDSHFLRKMVVAVNGIEQEPAYYIRQKSPVQFQDTITVKANPKDVIAVKVFCSEGGSKVTSLIVPEPPEAK